MVVPTETSRALHGYVLPNSPVADAVVDASGRIRYGVSDAERSEMINRLSAPGVKEYAYDAQGGFDPAAAERFTDAYLFGKKWQPRQQAQETLVDLIAGNRELWNKLGAPGVGEERPRLVSATIEGMRRGSEEQRQVGEDFGLQGSEIKSADGENALSSLADKIRWFFGMDKLDSAKGEEMGQPWEDPSLSTDSTKKLKEDTEKMRMRPPKKGGPARAPVGITALEAPLAAAAAEERKKRKIAKGLAPISGPFSGTPQR